MRALSAVVKVAKSPATDRRAHLREVVNRRAKALDGPFALNAILKDISPGGARLAFPERAPCQQRLVVVDLDLATAYACEIIWRRGVECGVKILRTQDLRGLVPGQFDPARRVWLAARHGG